jgi:hypothetical protein
MDISETEAGLAKLDVADIDLPRSSAKSSKRIRSLPRNAGSP